MAVISSTEWIVTYTMSNVPFEFHGWIHSLDSVGHQSLSARIPFSPWSRCHFGVTV